MICFVMFAWWSEFHSVWRVTHTYHLRNHNQVNRTPWNWTSMSHSHRSNNNTHYAQISIGHEIFYFTYSVSNNPRVVAKALQLSRYILFGGGGWNGSRPVPCCVEGGAHLSWQKCTTVILKSEISVSCNQELPGIWLNTPGTGSPTNFHFCPWRASQKN